MNYAKTIKAYRERALITQVELAKMLEVGVSNVSRWERGNHETTIATKKKLKKLFEEAGIGEGKNE